MPGAEHVAWGIDSVDGTIGAESDLASEGFELSRDTVLTATALRPPSRGVDAELRALVGDEDWRQALELRIACLPDDEHYTEPFVRAHLAGSRALCEQGSATWFGAFEDGTLRAALGIVSDGDGLARFQMVETHPDRRRRGLASALLHRAGGAALQAGAETLVIVADPGYHAIGLYRAGRLRRPRDEGRADPAAARGPVGRRLDSDREDLRRDRRRGRAGRVDLGAPPRARGAQVLLLDSARFPRDKPCGGGLTGRAVRRLPVIRRLGGRGVSTASSSASATAPLRAARARGRWS